MIAFHTATRTMLFQDQWENCLASFLLGVVVTLLCVWLYYYFKDGFAATPSAPGSANNKAVCQATFTNPADQAACERMVAATDVLISQGHDATLTDRVKAVGNFADGLTGISPASMQAAIARHGHGCIPEPMVSQVDKGLDGLHAVAHLQADVLPRVSTWATELRQEMPTCPLGSAASSQLADSTA